MYVNTFAASVRATDATTSSRSSRRQRACRDVPRRRRSSDADVARLLEAATYAPSAENRQPWEFIVVRDRALIASHRRARPGGHGTTVGRAFSRARSTPKLLADVERGATGGIAAAPVHIVVCADTERGLEQTVPSSIFPAVQNLLLAATALGLGSALTTIALDYRAELTSLLALPDTVVPVARRAARPSRPSAGATSPRSVRATHPPRPLRRSLVSVWSCHSGNRSVRSKQLR